MQLKCVPEFLGETGGNVSWDVGLAWVNVSLNIKQEESKDFSPRDNQWLVWLGGRIGRKCQPWLQWSATTPHLGNCDETGLYTAAGAKSLLVKWGSKEVSEVSGGSDRVYFTIHCAGCASEETLPPLTLHKGKNMYHWWMVGGPAGAQ